MISAVLPRWFRLLLILDLALVVAVVVLGARLALDGAHDAARVITWTNPAVGAAPSPPASGPSGAAPVPVAPAAPAPPAVRPPLGPALLDRLDSDTARSANAQRGLLGLLEEALRVRVVDILEHVERRGGGG
jgi:hypothetical protein